jgi:hypothetical protein
MSLPTLNLDEQEPDAPSCTFTIGGRSWSARSASDVPFAIVKRMFVAQTEQTVSEVVAQVGPFLKALIAEKDWPEFEQMMDRTDSPLTQKAVTALVPYLLEQVMGIPTTPPEPSTAGRRPTGSKSKAVSSSRGTRRKAS